MFLFKLTKTLTLNASREIVSGYLREIGLILIVSYPVMIELIINKNIAARMAFANY